VKKEDKGIIKEAYSKIATSNGSCCSNCGCSDEKSSHEVTQSIGYSAQEIQVAPEANLGLGCGNITALGEINEGEVVLDLGSGAGFDVEILSEDKEISEKQYSSIALESLKLKATKKS